jgi:hypothetical protein
MYTPKRFFLVLTLLALALAACSPVAAGDPAAGGSALIFAPADGAQFALGDLVMVTTGLLQDAGAVSASLLVNGESQRIDELNAPLTEGSMHQGWQPQAEGSYTLQVAFHGTDGSLVESNMITIVVGAAVQESNGEAPSPTPVETTPTTTPTPAPEDATANADVDANCRFGPGTVYQVIGIFQQGESSPIVGRSDPTGWWLINNPDSSGTCWVADSTVSITGETDAVSIVVAPPTPLPTSTSTPTAIPANPPTPVQVSPSGSFSCTSSVDLIWQAVSHPVSIAYYEWVIEWYTGYQWALQDTGQTSGTSQNAVIGCGINYRWHVRAVDSNGAASPYSGDMEFNIAP